MGHDCIEARLFNALCHHVTEPALFEDFCDESTRKMNRPSTDNRISIDVAEFKVEQMECKLNTLLNVILECGEVDRVNEKMVAGARFELATFRL
jgi:hypothetical protein